MLLSYGVEGLSEVMLSSRNDRQASTSSEAEVGTGHRCERPVVPFAISVLRSEDHKILALFATNFF